MADERMKGMCEKHEVSVGSAESASLSGEHTRPACGVRRLTEHFSGGRPETAREDACAPQISSVFRLNHCIVLSSACWPRRERERHTLVEVVDDKCRSAEMLRLWRAGVGFFFGKAP
jgi:hypothetical protein